MVEKRVGPQERGGKSAERSEKRERERSTMKSMDPWPFRVELRGFACVLAGEL